MKVEKIMHEYKHGVLKSVKGDKDGNVKSRKQAIAIQKIFVLNLIDKREQRNSGLCWFSFRYKSFLQFIKKGYR